ncbi:MAG: tRNA lysidine(34) synthetase TilS [Candidatus Cloacimonadales bacterium]|nr:tRNA lysidine(34) synthetase TilS [Candidatus Cloacimonadales bacterium]
MGKNETFFERFEAFAKQHRLFQKSEKVLVGFSGGADSTALLLALWHFKSVLGFSILAAHVNYNLRGEDSLHDEEFVKKFCFQRNISLVIKDVKIKTKANLENQAREIRFGYFNELTELYNLDKIALGHNRADQAETILFRLFRGSGYTGIKGISPISGNIVHPILGFSRQEIEAYLKQENIQWREDKSNAENIFHRNRIRNEFIPWIQKNLNPNVIDKLYHAATIFTDTDEVLQELGRRRMLKAQISHNKNVYRYSLNYIRKTRPVIRFYLFKEIYSLFCDDGKDFYTGNFEEINAILDSNGSKFVELPNDVVVIKEYDELVFTDKISLAEMDVDVNHTKEIAALRNMLTFENTRISLKKLKKLPSTRYLFEDENTAYLDLDKTSFPITIRHRQPGDKFIPLGMQYSKKLKDFFIDEKVPKFERDKVLIFCDEEKILWIAGYRIDNRVITSESTNNILMIKIEKMAVNKARAAERIKKR